MLKDNFAMLGLGQAGGRMTKPFYDNDYRSFFINTSYDDLSSLKVKEDYIYHIPAAKGCAKKRNVALEYAKNYYDQMIQKLLDTHPTVKIFIAHYSLGGGTGGGLSNFVLATLRQKLNSINRKDVLIIVAAARPRKYESYQIQSNAIESLKELQTMVKAKVVNQYFLINNDSRETLEEINDEHMMLLDRWIEGESANNINNADESERMDLFQYQGGVVLFDCASNNKDTFKSDLEEAYDNMIYCTPSKKPEAVGMAINKAINEEIAMESLEDVVGAFPNNHFTPTQNSNIIMLAGLKENKTIKNNMIKLANEKYDKINSENETEDIEEVEFKKVSKKKNTSEDEEITIDSIDDVMNLFR